MDASFGVGVIVAGNSRKLGRKFCIRDSGFSITNDNEFCFLWVEFQFHTIHPLLNRVRHSISSVKLEHRI